MPINLKITLGVVNYTDFLHVTAAKVSQPSIILWETWIPMPVSNYNFIIPGLDPENYYISFYDASTSGALGSLQSQLIVNAFTGDTIIERRFYTTDGSGPNDPEAGDSFITDPYLIGKEVTGVFKEAFRYYQGGGVEWDFDAVNGRIDVLTGVNFSSGEKIIVEVFFKQQNQIPSSSAGGLYDGVIDVSESTRTLLAAEINTRVRLIASGNIQTLTLPLLSSFATDKGFYFDNTVGGSAIQTKLLTSGSDKILFNGFNVPITLFDEFWISQGEHLLIRKYGGNWEVITEYNGVHVGERVSLLYPLHHNVVVESGQMLDGDVYPRLWWWINNVLPVSYKYTRNQLLAIDNDRRGQFSLHPSEKKFFMPFTVNTFERGMHNYSSVGPPDPNRAVSFPGGFQTSQVGTHTHKIKYNWRSEKGTSSSPNIGTASYIKPKFGTGFNEEGETEENAVNKENRVANVGVIYARRI